MGGQGEGEVCRVVLMGFLSVFSLILQREKMSKERKEG